jgi:hypothetical protein
MRLIHQHAHIIAIIWLLSLATSISAQTVVLDTNLADLGFGFLHVQPVKLEGRQGFLAYLPYYDLWTVIVPNAPRSGMGGMVPVPGVCIEHWFQLPPGSDYVGIVDGNGDGQEDLIAGSATWLPVPVITLDVAMPISPWRHRVVRPRGHRARKRPDDLQQYVPARA